jgi:NADPH-dependent 2,4-dienoyl-CoA reductase/sulfur reductase-like enzyme/rhodanese-related sulfurtransferase
MGYTEIVNESQQKPAVSPRRVVIVGGVAGGMSAATRMRRLDASAEIVVLERSGYVSYANCGLPYYVGGVIAQERELLLQTPASLHARFRLDVRTQAEVLDIDRAAKTVHVKNLVGGTTYDLAYDHLILSPGAVPVVPPLPGIERAFTLRTVEDVQRIVTAVQARPKNAVVIGGGFIGVEAAENLRHLGIDVTLVEAAPQLLAPLDIEMANPVADEMRRHGVNLRLGVALKAVHDDSVELTDGTVLPSDFTLLAIGVRPDTSLAQGCGLEVGARGGIAVDAMSRTSDANIFAIGDAAEKRDALDGSATLVPLANVANRQGRRVADTIMGRDVRPVDTQGTAIVKVFDLTVATTGWNEKRLVAADRQYLALHAFPGSHAGYYPGAEAMALKLLLDPRDGTILGAQGVGRDGVDKRLDVLATAMRAGLTGPELADLELAYAPPFGSAKDAINMLGYMAENVMTGLSPTVQWHEVEGRYASGAFILDVRTIHEFVKGSIPGSVNVPVDALRERIDELPKDRQILVTCAAGLRGHTATALLRELGYDAVNLDGGYNTWSAATAGLPIEESWLPILTHPERPLQVV